MAIEPREISGVRKYISITSRVVLSIITLIMMGPAPLPQAFGGALEDYLNTPDPHHSWQRTTQSDEPWGTVSRLEMTSQQWRGHLWTHRLLVVEPKSLRNADIAFLLIAGDGDGEKHADTLKILAQRGGATAAVITGVPNQPLFDGRREDALVAYTLEQYLATSDETWPLLFPMVKSAVRGMDTVHAFTAQTFGHRISRFVVSGASKRGWTTWLTAAADRRVSAIAPMVIDMLNMRVQLQWSEKVYGKPSEKISDYHNLQLHIKADDPPVRKLRGWIDPYAYRNRYTMPKLLLLGTNDPYWAVDSLRHYWHDLPEPKWVFQTPNAGHDLAGGTEATQTLAAFFELIADRQPLPKVKWTLGDDSHGSATARVRVDRKATAIRLWSANSIDRDFRNDVWTSLELAVKEGRNRADAKVERPQEGYRSYLMEVELRSPGGYPYKLSTEARVTPDTMP